MHQQHITNLSDFELSAAEESLLRKGLNYIPSARDLSCNELLNGFDALRTTLRKSNDRNNKDKKIILHQTLKNHHACTNIPTPFTEGLLEKILPIYPPLMPSPIFIECTD